MSDPSATPPQQTAPPLRMLFWESTARCNLRCIHCRRTETDPAEELSTDALRAVLADLVSLGPPVVVFSGGEPLLRDDWEDLADACRDLGLRTALASNGTLIDDALAARIARAGFARVAVSLDGPDAGTHDAFRGQPGAFAATCGGLAALRRAGVETQINVTVTTRNAETLPAMLDLAERAAAAAVHLFLLVPVGCGARLGPDLQLPPPRYRQLLDWVLEYQQSNAPLELRATCAPQLARVARQRGIDLRGGGCLCGRSVVFLNHRGEVYPCGYLPVTCGSVREQSIKDIWVNAGVLQSLRDPGRLEDACGDCGFGPSCGGCRARAYAATGNLHAAEPGCPFAAS